MSEETDRRAELIAAALAGELTPSEQAELEEVSRRDPTVAAEIAELRQTLGRLDAAGLSWVEADPPADLVGQIAAAVDADGMAPDGTAPDGMAPDGADLDEVAPGGAAPDETGLETSPLGGPHHAPTRRQRWLLPVAAACLVGVGVGGTLIYQDLTDAPVEGPPGTLGAVEEISFAGEPPGSRVEASVVAHTWGTETFLEIDGFEVGETFEVVLVSATGEEFSSGTFIGSEVTVVCQMNAAVLREEVHQVRIESVDETVSLVADLPEATA